MRRLAAPSARSVTLGSLCPIPPHSNRAKPTSSPVQSIVPSQHPINQSDPTLSHHSTQSTNQIQLCPIPAPNQIKHLQIKEAYYLANSGPFANQSTSLTVPRSCPIPSCS